METQLRTSLPILHDSIVLWEWITVILPATTCFTFKNLTCILLKLLSLTIIQTEVINEWEWINEWGSKGTERNQREWCSECNRARKERKWLTEGSEARHVVCKHNGMTGNQSISLHLISLNWLRLYWIDLYYNSMLKRKELINSERVL